VKDLKAARKFYEGTLELEPVGTEGLRLARRTDDFRNWLIREAA
jgi:catechol 2,3-dioxygenase-like lactoylglutathione lyase family enzyme